MRIGGFHPLSLCDYPGRVAAVVFTQGCTMRCPFCHNGSLLPVHVPAQRLIPVEVVLDTLEKRKAFLSGVVVSGGEPTLHRGLPTFLAQLKGLGLAVKLDTNGSNPTLLRKLIADGLVDYIAMDVKAPWAKYSLLTGVSTDIERIRESMDLIAQSGLAHEFRTTFVPQLLTGQDLEAIRGLIPPGSPYRVQRFIPQHALAPALRSGH